MSETAQEAPPETAPEPTEAPQEPDAPFEEPEPAGGEEEAEEAAEEPAPPEQTGLSIEELEKVRKKLDQSASTWRNRVSDLLGEEAQMLVPCELCDPLIPGFHWPAEIEQPRDEMHARLLDVLRTPVAPEYLPAPNVRRCATCDGWGKVESGSRVAGKGAVVCPICKGFGFQGDAAMQQAPFPTNGAVEFEGPPDSTPMVNDNVDNWGTPKFLGDGQENPNWGRQPQFWYRSLPHCGQ